MTSRTPVVPAAERAPVALPRELGLYAHIPFCARKCFYCDFNSYAGYDAEHKHRYMRALIRELEMYAPGSAPANHRGRVPGDAPPRPSSARPLTSAFIGGGTPTLVDPADLAAFLRRIKELFPTVRDLEVTCEANPASATVEGLTLLREAGVNRLSFGVQAFQNRLLERLGRAHDADAAREAVADARAAGFDNVNIDLMYGLPGQTLDDWRETLERALELETEHISAYSLIVEEGTPFMLEYRAGTLDLPTEEAEDEMHAHLVERLAQAGFRQYEISNFSRPGRECRHNLLYWDNGEFFGLGAGAHSRLGMRRLWNVRPIPDYVRTVEADELPLGGSDDLDSATDMGDTMMLGLRRMQGVSRRAFSSRFGVELDSAYPGVARRLADEGLLADEGDALRLTRRGTRLANRVWAAFLPEPTTV